MRTLSKPEIIKSESRPTEGNEYYYERDNGTGISRGTCMNCEKCYRHGVQNSMTIVSFPKGHPAIVVNTYLYEGGCGELYYNERWDMAMCNDCEAALDKGEDI